MTWCYLPETDCPSAQEPVALIWASAGWIWQEPETPEDSQMGFDFCKEGAK